ncbi:polyprenyl synthetase, partial [Mycobacterium tuberculosis]
MAPLVAAGGPPFRPLFPVLAAPLGSAPAGWAVPVAGAALALLPLGPLCPARVVAASALRRPPPSAPTRWPPPFALLAGA